MAKTIWTGSIESAGGAEKVARILNLLPEKEREETLAGIEEESPKTAEEIRRLMFVFEDLIRVPERDLRILLQDVDAGITAAALRGASEELLGRVERCLSRRRAEMLREEMEVSSPMRMSDVEAARSKMLRTALKLKKEGRIRLGNDPGEVWIE